MKHSRQWRFWAARGLAAVLLVGAVAGPSLVTAARAQEGPTIEVVSPQPGATVSSDDVPVEVKVSNFTVDCLKAGRPNEDGVGHIHLMIDGMSMAQLANFYCADSFTVPGEGLSPGKHTLIVDLATNDHLDMMDTAKEVEFDYQPAHPAPLPKAQDLGTPGLELVSPTDGATVPAKFTIEVKPVNFTPSERLEGKQNVPGYGHWHVFVDTPMSGMMMGEEATGTPMAEEAMGTPMAEEEMGTPMAAGEMGDMHMMAMGGMVLMPGTNTFDVELTVWGPGEHTIFIEPVQNDHTNFAEFGHIEFTVNVE